MKIQFYVCLTAMIAFICTKTSAQPTTINLPIGKVLEAGTAGLALPDGNRIYAQRIGLGLARTEVQGSSDDYATFGKWNVNPGETGGPLNGVNNLSNTNTGSALTLSGYTGSNDPATFTNITGRRINVSQGGNPDNPYKNAVGIRVWFDRPVTNAQYLFLDIDGGQGKKDNGNDWDSDGYNDNTGNNAGWREWHTGFGYSGHSRIQPDRTLGDLLRTRTANPLSANWKNQLLVDAFGANAALYDPFQIIDEASNGQTNPLIAIRNNNTSGSNAPDDTDPDNTRVQVLYKFTQPIDNFFTLWGLFDNKVGSEANRFQNSGMSAFTFLINADYGDLPDTYGTKFESGGATHGIYAGLQLGTTGPDADVNGKPNDPANGDDSDTGGDDEDGILNAGGDVNQDPPKIPNLVITGSETIASYSVSVKAKNTIENGGAARIIGWIDWNRNGTFESDEASNVVSVPNGTADVNSTLTWTGKVLNHDNFKGSTYMRIRISTDAKLDASYFKGALNDGEVEDYTVLMNVDDTGFPVELISFKGKRDEANNVFLEWQTASESLSKGFEIQRSADAKKFETIGFIASSNMGVAVNKYTYVDQLGGQAATINYYRLKMVDQDETFSYSTIINIKSAGLESNAFIYPVPVKSNGTITVSNTKVTSLQISNAGGKLIPFDMKSDYKNGDLKLNNLPAGNYILRINNDRSIRFVVE